VTACLARYNVRLTVTGMNQSKRLKLGLCNFHRTVDPSSVSSG